MKIIIFLTMPLLSLASCIKGGDDRIVKQEDIKARQQTSAENHKKEDHSVPDHDGKKHEENTDKDDHSGHGDHEEGGGKAVGKGKAIEEVDEVKGFKLSKEAIKSLNIKLETVDGDEFKISKSTLVASKDKKGIYRFRGGFFKFLPVILKKEVSGKYLVKVKGVDFGDQIVIDGVGLLRVSDVYSTDNSEYGHSH